MDINHLISVAKIFYCNIIKIIIKSYLNFWAAKNGGKLMNKNPLVSVAMTCFNQGHFIKDAIKSVVNQTYENWQLVIVNDCSTDNSLKAINKYIDSYGIKDKVKLINHEKNNGYGASLGEAVKCSDGELVAIVDSDDGLAENDAFEICVKAHLDHPEVAMTYSNYWICRQNLSRKKMYQTKQIPKDKMYLGAGIRVSHLKVLKKKFYLMTDGINLKLKQTVDKDLTLRIEEVGKLLHIDKALYHYRHHPENLSRSLGSKDVKYRKFVVKMRKQIYEDARKRRKL